MKQVEVEITGLVITSRYGTLKQGDILRTDSEFADHLVNDCSAAKPIGTLIKAAPAAVAPRAKAKPTK